MVDRTVRAGTAHEADDDPVRIVDALLGLGRPVPTTDPADWLLRDSFAVEDMLSFFDEFCWRLVGWSLPLSRVTLHVTALHPQLSGFGCRWTRRTGRIERLAIALGGYDTRTFDQSPIKSSVVDGESLRCRLFRATETGFPVLDRLKRDGATDYLALPLLRWQTGFPTVTFATDQAEGFSDLQIGRLERLTAPLGAVIQTRIARRVTIDLLATYLGERAGARVLAGSVHRGRGEWIRAVILASDLRGSTGLSERMPGETFIELLDDYFECVALPIQSQGGEILKFIGDGVLGIFPVGKQSEACAARAAIDAATQARTRLHALRPNATHGWAEPLQAGFGLHIGAVFFGNVGAPGRLDFTAIGSAVNLAFRLESLTKSLGCSIAASADLASLVTGLIPLGSASLPGMALKVEVWGDRKPD